MSRKIEIDDEDAETLREYLLRRAGPDWMLAVDPGQGKTGFAHVSPMDGDTITSGVAAHDEAAMTMLDEGMGMAQLYVIERPYSAHKPKLKKNAATGEVELEKTRGGPDALWKLGRAMGFVEGVLVSDRLLRGMRRPLIYRPRPGNWRAVLGLNPSRSSEDARRDAELRAWHFARSLTGDPLEGTGGGPQFDRAMAICMIESTRQVLRALRRSRPKAAA